MEIQYHKCTNAEEAYQSVKRNITAETIAKYKVSPEFVYNDEQKSLVAQGSGFTLTAQFYDSYLAIDLNLSFLLKPLKNKILEALEKQIGRVV